MKVLRYLYEGLDGSNQIAEKEEVMIANVSPIVKSVVYTLAALFVVVLLSVAGSHKAGSAPSVQSTLSRLQSGN